MPNYEVQHNSHRTSDGEVHEPGSVIRLTEAQARLFSFKLRRLEDELPPQLNAVSAEVVIETVVADEEPEIVVGDVATSMARRLADEVGLDLSVVTGTGKDDKITVADVRSALEVERNF